ncbi:hypothetical protein [Streptomyces sp. NPDC097619]|uniref:hypothetical protein n=1 Tax=Streptomyces sp. NPDC097619 TaxID=3157228 RepID=UPI00331C98A6
MNWLKRVLGGSGGQETASTPSSAPDGTPVPVPGVVKTSGPAGAVHTGGSAAVVPEPVPAPARAGAPVLQRESGTGARTVKLDTGTRPLILTITHEGPGHFVVDLLDGRLRAGSQAVYTTGPFVARALANADDRPVRAVRVTADGPWTIEVTGIEDALAVTERAERPASDVLRYEGGPALATLRYAGSPRHPDGGYFLTDTFAPDGSGFLDDLANDNGPWEGEVPLPGPCLLYARADGPWTITIRPFEAA